ncbi:acyl-CoA dehydrogenase [Pseudomaricurvus alkylphenolicus]|jgi:acyl-CoA dehydrogenase|uniref:acyl-CoA dehydrogenase family protein n=1 Tax=Pseudomaricurvus alkylphenolicus TaxID=1306991 RepID=UPI00141E3F15|nr:acyl-CoA dehydrogenase family protein [Pseudomaricurvus alkylphenolicus]NIB39000.1 acyl-CoA dehydrogenase [Pseudomaricurvus alkylphenolicus]
MDATPSATQLDQLRQFMNDYIYPNEHRYRELLEQQESPWCTPPLMEELKAEAQRQGLWNLFLPRLGDTGLTNLEYAPLAEEMGRVLWASEVFNCNAPDTGNMEVLSKYGSPEQKSKWLHPLLDGTIRSAFAMTEPDVASSDATNIECSIDRDGDEYIINGRKWFTTGAMRESCELLILMGKTDASNPSRHLQQSMVLVPRSTPGVRVLRSVTTLGYAEQPYGEPEIVFDNVRVPVENILLGEGRGFEIAQGRLGPGRIHHCMRLIGCAQRALEMMCRRSQQRVVCGQPLSKNQSVREDIARSYCDIEQARLLTLTAADKMDKFGNKVARDLISAIKIAVPNMATRVIDRAIQLHGAAGLSGDLFLAEAYCYARQIRLADGPDQVHMMSLGKQLIREFGDDQ